MDVLIMDSKLSTVTDTVAEKLEGIIESLPSALPSPVEFMPTVKLILLLVVVSLGIGIVIRLIFGQSSSFNRSLSCAMGILFIYALTISVYTFNPWSLSRFLSPLPFALFRGDTLFILPFTNSPFSMLCREVLSMVILAFLVNLMDVLLPQGHSAIGWYLARFITAVSCIFLNLTVNWAANNYLPGFLTEYAPAILLIILLSFLFLGILRFILGLIIASANPFMGILYTFFFSSLIGKQVTKSVLTTVFICIFFYVVEWSGYTVIAISAAALLAYLPLAAVLLVLWYLLGHEL